MIDKKDIPEIEFTLRQQAEFITSRIMGKVAILCVLSGILGFTLGMIVGHVK